ncbi:MAG TPA: sulfite exporter TauE/SafE family protein [Sporichthyaceae bacterium]|nr:sulfite exporter TauE/SafE family protein [Sporichthyaceae bacterium]
MTPWHAGAVLAAGIAAGAINAVVGSGTLITFPTLLALGYPAVLANVSNTVGLVPGSAAAVWAYRRELSGQGSLLAKLCPASTIGAIVGGVLLLRLPAGAFRAVVPALIAVACVLVVIQPRLTAALTRRPAKVRGQAVALMVAVALTGVYGGYFGAAQGVLLIGLLATLSVEPDMQRTIAAKNVLALTANLVAGLLFLTVHHVDWAVAGLIAGGSTLGGLVGGRLGRRLPPSALRAVIVVIGAVAVIRMA